MRRLASAAITVFALGCAIPFGLNARQMNAWMLEGNGLKLMREFYAKYNIVNFVGGNTGAFTGFMIQRGRMVICGNAGKNLGDSMYDGTIYIAGEPASLGVDAVWAAMTDLDKAWLERKLRRYDVTPKGGIDSFRKIVAGKQLWNYDNLEPTEKKLVL